MSVFTPKKILIIGAGIFILFVGVGIGLKMGKIQLASPAVPMTTNQKLGETVSQNKSEANTIKVTRVIDGDTIEIEGGERVRYIGIDTPETVDPRKPVQCFGVEASNKNKELVEGKTVRLEKDITDRDKYNRLLRYVYVGDTFINLELVKQGFAYSYSYPPDIKYQEQFVKSQQEAREAKRGLWNACPNDSRVGAFSTTSNQTVSPSQIPNGSCLIKGNISASGEKIYHLPECGSYSKTQINVSRGEKWFCTEAEAQSAGWRKALNCP
jgi:micrococcal nuclease